LPRAGCGQERPDVPATPAKNSQPAVCPVSPTAPRDLVDSVSTGVPRGRPSSRRPPVMGRRRETRSLRHATDQLPGRRAGSHPLARPGATAHPTRTAQARSPRGAPCRLPRSRRDRRRSSRNHAVRAPRGPKLARRTRTVPPHRRSALEPSWRERPGRLGCRVPPHRAVSRADPAVSGSRAWIFGARASIVR